MSDGDADAHDETAARHRSTRALAVFLITGVASAYTLLRGHWPEIFTFATDPNAGLLARLASAPIHLADDVMITVRSGEMILRTGSPVFNQTDVAQAATSYLAPYLFAGIRLALPFNVAVMVFAAAGFACVVATYAVIAARASSLVNGGLLVAGLALTTTNLEFALSGWDHLLQGLLVVIAVALVLTGSLGLKRLVLISVLAALASLARPDGAVIAAGILLAALLISSQPWKTRLIGLMLPFGVIGAFFLLLNEWQFGHITPTTARLKAGAAPSLTYARDYLWNNGVESFTAASLFVIVTVAGMAFWRWLPKKAAIPVGVGAIVTAGIAAVNSDFFPGARMFWVPCVAVVMLLSPIPGLLRTGPAFRTDPQGNLKSRLGPLLQWVVAGVAVAVLVAVSLALGIRGAVVSKEALADSRTAEQYVATQWIEAMLSPADGSIGVFYAGEAAHVMNFEAADFLGKADEMIATTPTRWGPPGHNKWDIDATLTKWHPQVILPTIDQDPNDTSSDSLAAEWRERKWTHGYLADLITNPTIRSDYSYCRLPDPTGWSGATVDVYVRNDVVTRLGTIANCYS